MSYRRDIGRWGEEVARQYLGEQGYQILDSNVYTPYGEIDLVVFKEDAQGNKLLVFVEVKTRTSDAFGHPEDSIDRRKLEHLLNSIEAYLENHEIMADQWRVDVISIRKFKNQSEHEIVHFEDIAG